MISSYVFTSPCSRDGVFRVRSVIRREHTWCCNDLIMLHDYGPPPPNTFEVMLWTLNGHCNLPVACQSWESHLYASKPLAWHLTWQSSVNYPVTDNRAVISQTIKQAIKRLWIASSGPARLPKSPFNGGVKVAQPSCDTGRFLYYLYTYLRVCLVGFPHGAGGARGVQSPWKGPGSDSAVTGKWPRPSRLAPSGSV